jgi:hypothetical protein
VSRFCVTNWKKKGLLGFAPDGRVDVAASEALLDSRPVVYRGGVTNRAPSGPNVTRSLHSKKPKPDLSQNGAESAPEKRTEPPKHAMPSKPKPKATHASIEAPSRAEPPAAIFAALAGLPPELIAASAGWTLADAQREKERYLALLRRHEYELKSGSTVSVKEVELFLAARHGAIRDHILGWPGKLAEMCAERSRAEIEEILLREAYEVLEELAEGLPT